MYSLMPLFTVSVIDGFRSTGLTNVAVSRARRRLFVIGSHAEWSGAPNFADLAARLPRHPWPASQAWLDD
jgi:hypothetical protein